jgi:hypothetical protein
LVDPARSTEMARCFEFTEGHDGIASAPTFDNQIEILTKMGNGGFEHRRILLDRILTTFSLGEGKKHGWTIGGEGMRFAKCHHGIGVKARGVSLGAGIEKNTRRIVRLLRLLRP